MTETNETLKRFVKGDEYIDKHTGDKLVILSAHIDEGGYACVHCLEVESNNEVHYDPSRLEKEAGIN